jgi:hypothetical protein
MMPRATALVWPFSIVGHGTPGCTGQQLCKR